MIRLAALLTLLLASCSSPGTRKSPAEPAPSVVKARMRSSIPAVLMGLQDQVALQRPTQHSAVWNDSAAHAGTTFNDMAGAGQAGMLLLPLHALNFLMPPARLLASGGTVSAKKAEDAARRMNARATQRNWSETVRSSIVREWAARGASFSSVRTYRPESPSAGPYPLSPQGLAEVSGPVLLFIHVVGPSLSAEGDKLNPRIGPSLLLHWKVVDTRSGKVLARGTVAEHSPLRKTLLDWVGDGDAGMVPELERVIHDAAAKLAASLR